MNTRFLKQAFVLLLCSLFFAGTALWLVSVKEPRSYGGSWKSAIITLVIGR